VTRIDEQGDMFEEELLPVEEVDGPAPKAGAKPATKELIIRFEYKATPKGTKQDVLAAKAVETVLADAAVKGPLAGLGPTCAYREEPPAHLAGKAPERLHHQEHSGLLHPQGLGRFFERELDFYIKNEVMHLDDVQNASAFADIEKSCA
jgi:adenine-specific DNA-methyltransferase